LFNAFLAAGFICPLVKEEANSASDTVQSGKSPIAEYARFLIGGEMNPGEGIKWGLLTEWLARPPCTSFFGGKSRNLGPGSFLPSFFFSI
jgi:hypothetical protein